jgi:multisubunit Na+/H+ antiporter MnhB subunit
LSPGGGFTLFLLTTDLLLALVLATGLRAKRRVHIPAVVAMVISLGITIYFAEKLGEQYDVRSAGLITPIHLTLAKITTVGYLAPIATGIMTLRDPRRRKLHGRIAFVLVGMTLLTTGTGLAMLLLADPISR